MPPSFAAMPASWFERVANACASTWPALSFSVKKFFHASRWRLLPSIRSLPASLTIRLNASSVVAARSVVLPDVTETLTDFWAPKSMRGFCWPGP